MLRLREGAKLENRKDTNIDGRPRKGPPISKEKKMEYQLGNIKNATKAKYMGRATDEQVRWGSNDDPRGLLEPGKIYTIADVEVHSYHTKIYLVDFPGLKFNSVHFELS